MPLPIAPPPRSNDVATQGWAGITVRVAWTLLGLGIKPRAELLADARAHALYQIEPNTPLTHAEDLATRLTEEFVARGRGKNPAHPWSADWDVPISQRWRRTLDGLLDEPARLVFRKHYGDRRTLEWLAEHVSSDGRPVDRTVLESVRSGLRNAARHIGRQDGLPMDTWAPERIDRLLQRLAAYAPPPCPRVLDVSEGCFPEHVAGCPRCDRMLRLLQHEEIAIDDLQPPSIGARPNQHTSVIALHLHPEGRRSRRRLREALGERIIRPTRSAQVTFPVGDDLILLPGDEPDRVATALRLCAEIGEPDREHVRGVLLEGPGHWTSLGLVGPLPERAAREVLFRAWGTVDAIGELPPPLPAPPSAMGMWALVAGVALLGLPLAPWALEAYPWQHPRPPIEVRFADAAGVWVTFDVPDASVVSIVAARGEQLVPWLPARSAADKAPLAVGDGTYRAWIDGEGVLVAISDRPILDLAELVASAQREADPLRTLAERLEERAEVEIHSAR